MRNFASQIFQIPRGRRRYIIDVVSFETDELGAPYIICSHRAYGDEQLCAMSIRVNDQDKDGSQSAAEPTSWRVEFQDRETLVSGVVTFNRMTSDSGSSDASSSPSVVDNGNSVEAESAAATTSAIAVARDPAAYAVAKLTSITNDNMSRPPAAAASEKTHDRVRCNIRGSVRQRDAPNDGTFYVSDESKHFFEVSSTDGTGSQAAR